MSINLHSHVSDLAVLMPSGINVRRSLLVVEVPSERYMTLSDRHTANLKA